MSKSKKIIKQIIKSVNSFISYIMINEFPNINTNNTPHWSTIYDFLRINQEAIYKNIKFFCSIKNF